MGTYYGTYSCGHPGEYGVYGPVKDRQRKADWYFENHVCQECLVKQRAKDAAESAAKSARQGLPALKGSEKQVAWAETIRQAILSAAEAGLADFTAEVEALDPGTTKETQETNIAIARAAIEDAKARAEARWWIDNRDIASAATNPAKMVIAALKQFQGASTRFDAAGASEAELKEHNFAVMVALGRQYAIAQEAALDKEARA